MTEKYILAIDQGTTASTALLIDAEGGVISSASREISRIFPRPGWVEQYPRELYQSVLSVAREAVEKGGISPSGIRCLGITNQRETTVVWDRRTGIPIGNAIGWQCRRTASICEELKKKGIILEDRPGGTTWRRE